MIESILTYVDVFSGKRYTDPIDLKNKTIPSDKEWGTSLIPSVSLKNKVFNNEIKTKTK